IARPFCPSARSYAIRGVGIDWVHSRGWPPTAPRTGSPSLARPDGAPGQDGLASLVMPPASRSCRGFLCAASAAAAPAPPPRDAPLAQVAPDQVLGDRLAES